MQLFLHGALARSATVPFSPSSAGFRRSPELPRLSCAGAGAPAVSLTLTQHASRGGSGMPFHPERRRRCVHLQEPAIIVAAVRSSNRTACTSSSAIRKYLEIELAVREYELDRYGVVNNAVYSNYCEHGHHTLIAEITTNTNQIDMGVDVASFALSELDLKYIAPLRSGDRFVMKARIAGICGARIFTDIFIYKLPNLEPILEAAGTIICLNRSYRPTRVPNEVSSKILQYYSERVEEKVTC